MPLSRPLVLLLPSCHKPLDKGRRTRWKGEVSPRFDFNTSRFSLERHDRIFEDLLFDKRSFSAAVILRVMIAPVIVHVPRIVPGTPWERVFAMKPLGCSWQTKVPLPSIDIVSFKSRTEPCQCPTIFAEYSASETGGEPFAQDTKQNPEHDYCDCPYPRRAISLHEINSFPPLSLNSVVDGATGAIASFTMVCASSRIWRRCSAPRKLLTSLGTLTSIAGSAGFPANGLTFMALPSPAVATFSPRSPSACRTAC